MHNMASPRAELRLVSGFALTPVAAAVFAFAAYRAAVESRPSLDGLGDEPSSA
jgi:hypothetical protein